MSAVNERPHISPERRKLEAQANALRARLVRELDSIVTRKRRITDPMGELRRHPTEALVLGGTAAACLAAGIGLIAYRVSTRRERMRRARWEAWARLLTHPEKLTPKPSFLAGVLEKAASAALVATFTTVTKHVVDRVMQAPPRARPRPLPVVRALRAPDPFPEPPHPG